MPILKNDKYELFALKIAKGTAPNEAYTTIWGPSASVPQNACRLRAREEVAARIDELLTAERDRQERVAMGRRMTADDVVAKLEEMVEDPGTSENGRIKVLELVGKARGVEGFAPRHVASE